MIAEEDVAGLLKLAIHLEQRAAMESNIIIRAWLRELRQRTEGLAQVLETPASGELINALMRSMGHV